MARYKIKFNKKLCIGSGCCTSVCPENWSIVGEGDNKKARPKKLLLSEDELESNEQAEMICPVDAISIEKVKKRSVVDEEEFSDDLLY